jgi:hypothetical protein
METKYLYNHNETMKLLGQQPAIAFCDDTVRKAVNDIIEAYTVYRVGGIDIIEVMVDSFALGRIYGKREERQRRKQRMEV